MIAILVVLSGVVIVFVREYMRGQALSSSITSISAMLSDARTRTLSGKGGVQYGVHFGEDSAVLFLGSTYIDGAEGNEITNLYSRVTIKNVDLFGGGRDVVFDKLTGNVANHGTVTLELISDSSRQKTITIQKTGLVSYE